MNNIKVVTALKWLLEEIQVASEIYGIQAGLIITISRGDSSAEHLNSLLNAYEELQKPKLVIGLDLAGNENIIIANSVSSLFKRAKDKYNLKITIHAGETGKIENVIEAIENFDADRIGHGTVVAKDQHLMEYIKKKNICIEICPISNRLTGAISADEAHPVISFLEQDIPFVICSDNPAIHGKDITDDYLSFYEETKRHDILDVMFERQKQYSFIKGIK